MKALTQVDFYTDGRVVYFYDDNTQAVKQFERGLTAKEALHKRLEEKKKLTNQPTIRNHNLGLVVIDRD
jgi:hypothetical protein